MDPNGRNRLPKEETGFTLIELLVVVILIGVLVAIAVPAYLTLSDRANRGAAQANLRAMVPAMEAYHSDNDGYVGMTVAGLRNTYDSALKAPPAVTVRGAASSTGYCVMSSVANNHYFKRGPGGDITTTACTGP